MAYKSPRGGTHEDCLHSLRPQGAHQFAGGNYPGLRKAILPMPECNVRTYLGLRTYFQTYASPACSASGHAPGRTHQKPTCGSAAEVTPAIGSTTRSLTRHPCATPTKIHADCSPHLPASVTCCRHSKARHVNACSAGILAAHSINGDAPVLSAATPAKRPIASEPLTPNFRQHRTIETACASGKISTSTRRAQSLLFAHSGNPALCAGSPELGAGHCPAGVWASSPRHGKELSEAI